MRPVLFDTSIYISAFRRKDEPAVSTRRVAPDSPVWLSSVVLEELYAGSGPRERRVIERLERDFDRVKRIVVPNLTDWTGTGRVLAQLALMYDCETIGRGRLTNDALIAVSASRLGITVLTANERDYRRLAEFRQFEWQVLAV